LSGKTVKITDSYLSDFAKIKLQPFLTDFTGDPHRGELTACAGSGTPGHDAVWNYNQLLTGNAKSNFAPALQLQGSYKAFATALSQRFAEIDTAARTIMEDMRMVDTVLNKGEDAANITAAEMTADLSNVSFSGTSGAGNGITPPPSSVTSS